MAEVFAAYRRYVALDRRFLLSAGGIDDQDALVIEGIAAVDTENARINPRPPLGLLS